MSCFYFLHNSSVFYLIETIYPRLLSQQISTYTGQKNTDFEILVSIHVKISRAIMLLILVAQVNSKTQGLIVHGSSIHFEHNVIRTFCDQSVQCVILRNWEKIYVGVHRFSDQCCYTCRHYFGSRYRAKNSPPRGGYLGFQSILFNASRVIRICRELWTSLQKMWDCFISTRRKFTQRLFFTY